jgi:hypothetical protein
MKPDERQRGMPVIGVDNADWEELDEFRSCSRKREEPLPIARLVIDDGSTEQPLGPQEQDRDAIC